MPPHTDAPSPARCYSSSSNDYGEEPAFCSGSGARSEHLQGTDTTTTATATATMPVLPYDTPSYSTRHHHHNNPLATLQRDRLRGSSNQAQSEHHHQHQHQHEVRHQQSAREQGRRLIPGVYVPTVCFFDPLTEDLDTMTIATHAVRLARAGVTGLTTQGSNGEAVHLTHAERRTVTATTRAALDDAGFPHLPIIVGCGAQSVRETVQLCVEAREAGGDFALVLPPSYYSSLFASDSATVVEFFTRVADASPIPIVIYSFPAVVSGLDMSSDVIVRLAEHDNIVGVKLTCGNTGKLNRIVAATRNPASSSTSGSRGNGGKEASRAQDWLTTQPPFVVLGGSADFTMQSVVGGGHGIIAGLGNVAPRACVHLFRLSVRQVFGPPQLRLPSQSSSSSSSSSSDEDSGAPAVGSSTLGRRESGQNTMMEAQQIQELVARGDWTAIQGGIVSTKAGLESWFGYGGYARSPLPRPTREECLQWEEGFREIVGLEGRLG